MSIRKIEAMHHYYGYGVGFCKDCPHFREKEYGRTYFKCMVYGDSASEATDWRKSYIACGLIDKPFPEDDIRIVKRIIVNRNDDESLPGQISIFDGEIRMQEIQNTKNYCSRCGEEVEDGAELCDKCMYEAQAEMFQYNMIYEPTFNPEDGSM